MWIFDEKWWPSQAIGGKVPPRYAAKRLAATAVEVEGPQPYEADGYGGPRYIAAVAGRVTADSKIDGREPGRPGPATSATASSPGKCRRASGGS